jgi:heme exporter protein D
MSTTTSPTLREYRAEQRRHERWRFWRRAAAIVAAIAVIVVVVLWTHSMMQRYVILGDDTARGQQMREFLAASATGSAAARDQYIVDHCLDAAKAFYGHGIAGDDEGVDSDGSAPPNEKAFFVACSGWTLGGHGGGGAGD